MAASSTPSTPQLSASPPVGGAGPTNGMKREDSIGTDLEEDWNAEFMQEELAPAATGDAGGVIAGRGGPLGADTAASTTGTAASTTSRIGGARLGSTSTNTTARPTIHGGVGRAQSQQEMLASLRALLVGVGGTGPADGKARPRPRTTDGTIDHLAELLEDARASSEDARGAECQVARRRVSVADVATRAAAAAAAAGSRQGGRTMDDGQGGDAAAAAAAVQNNEQDAVLSAPDGAVLAGLLQPLSRPAMPLGHTWPLATSASSGAAPPSLPAVMRMMRTMQQGQQNSPLSGDPTAFLSWLSTLPAPIRCTDSTADAPLSVHITATAAAAAATAAAEVSVATAVATLPIPASRLASRVTAAVSLPSVQPSLGGLHDSEKEAGNDSDSDGGGEGSGGSTGARARGAATAAHAAHVPLLPFPYATLLDSAAVDAAGSTAPAASAAVPGGTSVLGRLMSAALSFTSLEPRTEDIVAVHLSSSGTTASAGVTLLDRACPCCSRIWANVAAECKQPPQPQVVGQQELHSASSRSPSCVRTLRTVIRPYTCVLHPAAKAALLNLLGLQHHPQQVEEQAAQAGATATTRGVTAPQEVLPASVDVLNQFLHATAPFPLLSAPWCMAWAVSTSLLTRLSAVTEAAALTAACTAIILAAAHAGRCDYNTSGPLQAAQQPDSFLLSPPLADAVSHAYRAVGSLLIPGPSNSAGAPVSSGIPATAAAAAAARGGRTSSSSSSGPLRWVHVWRSVMGRGLRELVTVASTGPVSQGNHNTMAVARLIALQAELCCHAALFGCEWRCFAPLRGRNRDGTHAATTATAAATATTAPNTVVEPLASSPVPLAPSMLGSAEPSVPTAQLAPTSLFGATTTSTTSSSSSSRSGRSSAALLPELELTGVGCVLQHVAAVFICCRAALTQGLQAHKQRVTALIAGTTSTTTAAVAVQPVDAHAAQRVRDHALHLAALHYLCVDVAGSLLHMRAGVSPLTWREAHPALTGAAGASSSSAWRPLQLHVRQPTASTGAGTDAGASTATSPPAPVPLCKQLSYRHPSAFVPGPLQLELPPPPAVPAADADAAQPSLLHRPPEHQEPDIAPGGTASATAAAAPCPCMGANAAGGDGDGGGLLPQLSSAFHHLTTGSHQHDDKHLPLPSYRPLSLVCSGPHMARILYLFLRDPASHTAPAAAAAAAAAVTAAAPASVASVTAVLQQAYASAAAAAAWPALTAAVATHFGCFTPSSSAHGSSGIGSCAPTTSSVPAAASNTVQAGSTLISVTAGSACASLPCVPCISSGIHSVPHRYALISCCKLVGSVCLLADATAAGGSSSTGHTTSTSGAPSSRRGSVVGVPSHSSAPPPPAAPGSTVLTAMTAPVSTPGGPQSIVLPPVASPPQLSLPQSAAGPPSISSLPPQQQSRGTAEAFTGIRSSSANTSTTGSSNSTTAPQPPVRYHITAPSMPQLQSLCGSRHPSESALVDMISLLSATPLEPFRYEPITIYTLPQHTSAQRQGQQQQQVDGGGGGLDQLESVLQQLYYAATPGAHHHTSATAAAAATGTGTGSTAGVTLTLQPSGKGSSSGTHSSIDYSSCLSMLVSHAGTAALTRLSRASSSRGRDVHAALALEASLRGYVGRDDATTTLAFLQPLPAATRGSGRPVLLQLPSSPNGAAAVLLPVTRRTARVLLRAVVATALLTFTTAISSVVAASQRGLFPPSGITPAALGTPGADAAAAAAAAAAATATASASADSAAQASFPLPSPPALVVTPLGPLSLLPMYMRDADNDNDEEGDGGAGAAEATAGAAASPRPQSQLSVQQRLNQHRIPLPLASRHAALTLKIFRLTRHLAITCPQARLHERGCWYLERTLTAALTAGRFREALFLADTLSSLKSGLGQINSARLLLSLILQHAHLHLIAVSEGVTPGTGASSGVAVGRAEARAAVRTAALASSSAAGGVPPPMSIITPLDTGFAPDASGIGAAAPTSGGGGQQGQGEGELVQLDPSAPDPDLILDPVSASAVNAAAAAAATADIASNRAAQSRAASALPSPVPSATEEARQLHAHRRGRSTLRRRAKKARQAALTAPALAPQLASAPSLSLTGGTITNSEASSAALASMYVLTNARAAAGPQAQGTSLSLPPAAVNRRGDGSGSGPLPGAAAAPTRSRSSTGSVGLWSALAVPGHIAGGALTAGRVTGRAVGAVGSAVGRFTVWQLRRLSDKRSRAGLPRVPPVSGWAEGSQAGNAPADWYARNELLAVQGGEGGGASAPGAAVAAAAAASGRTGSLWRSVRSSLVSTGLLPPTTPSPLPAAAIASTAPGAVAKVAAAQPPSNVFVAPDMGGPVRFTRLPQAATTAATTADAAAGPPQVSDATAPRDDVTARERVQFGPATITPAPVPLRMANRRVSGLGFRAPGKRVSFSSLTGRSFEGMGSAEDGTGAGVADGGQGMSASPPAAGPAQLSAATFGTAAGDGDGGGALSPSHPRATHTFSRGNSLEWSPTATSAASHNGGHEYSPRSLGTRVSHPSLSYSLSITSPPPVHHAQQSQQRGGQGLAATNHARDVSIADTVQERLAVSKDSEEHAEVESRASGDDEQEAVPVPGEHGAPSRGFISHLASRVRRASYAAAVAVAGAVGMQELQDAVAARGSRSAQHDERRLLQLQCSGTYSDSDSSDGSGSDAEGHARVGVGRGRGDSLPDADAEATALCECVRTAATAMPTMPPTGHVTAAIRQGQGAGEWAMFPGSGAGAAAGAGAVGPAYGALPWSDAWRDSPLSPLAHAVLTHTLASAVQASSATTQPSLADAWTALVQSSVSVPYGLRASVAHVSEQDLRPLTLRLASLHAAVGAVRASLRLLLPMLPQDPAGAALSVVRLSGMHIATADSATAGGAGGSSRHHRRGGSSGSSSGSGSGNVRTPVAGTGRDQSSVALATNALSAMATVISSNPFLSSTGAAALMLQAGLGGNWTRRAWPSVFSSLSFPLNWAPAPPQPQSTMMSPLASGQGGVSSIPYRVSDQLEAGPVGGGGGGGSGMAARQKEQALQVAFVLARSYYRAGAYADAATVLAQALPALPILGFDVQARDDRGGTTPSRSWPGPGVRSSGSGSSGGPERPAARQSRVEMPTMPVIPPSVLSAALSSAFALRCEPTAGLHLLKPVEAATVWWSITAATSKAGTSTKTQQLFTTTASGSQSKHRRRSTDLGISSTAAASVAAGGYPSADLPAPSPSLHAPNTTAAAAASPQLQQPDGSNAAASPLLALLLRNYRVRPLVVGRVLKLAILWVKVAAKAGHILGALTAIALLIRIYERSLIMAILAAAGRDASYMHRWRTGGSSSGSGGGRRRAGAVSSTEDSDTGAEEAAGRRSRNRRRDDGMASTGSGSGTSARRGGGGGGSSSATGAAADLLRDPAFLTAFVAPYRTALLQLYALKGRVLSMLAASPHLLQPQASTNDASGSGNGSRLFFPSLPLPLPGLPPLPSLLLRLATGIELPPGTPYVAFETPAHVAYAAALCFSAARALASGARVPDAVLMPVATALKVQPSEQADLATGARPMQSYACKAVLQALSCATATSTDVYQQRRAELRCCEVLVDAVCWNQSVLAAPAPDNAVMAKATAALLQQADAVLEFAVTLQNPLLLLRVHLCVASLRWCNAQALGTTVTAAAGTAAAHTRALLHWHEARSLFITLFCDGVSVPLFRGGGDEQLCGRLLLWLSRLVRFLVTVDHATAVPRRPATLQQDVVMSGDLADVASGADQPQQPASSAPAPAPATAPAPAAPAVSASQPSMLQAHLGLVDLLLHAQQDSHRRVVESRKQPPPLPVVGVALAQAALAGAGLTATKTGAVTSLPATTIALPGPTQTGVSPWSPLYPFPPSPLLYGRAAAAPAAAAATGSAADGGAAPVQTPPTPATGTTAVASAASAEEALDCVNRAAGSVLRNIVGLPDAVCDVWKLLPHSPFCTAMHKEVEAEAEAARQIAPAMVAATLRAMIEQEKTAVRVASPAPVTPVPTATTAAATAAGAGGIGDGRRVSSRPPLPPAHAGHRRSRTAMPAVRLLGSRLESTEDGMAGRQGGVPVQLVPAAAAAPAPGSSTTTATATSTGTEVFTAAPGSLASASGISVYQPSAAPSATMTAALFAALPQPDAPAAAAAAAPAAAVDVPTTTGRGRLRRGVKPHQRAFSTLPSRLTGGTGGALLPPYPGSAALGISQRRRSPLTLQRSATVTEEGEDREDEVITPVPAAVAPGGAGIAAYKSAAAARRKTYAVLTQQQQQQQQQQLPPQPDASASMAVAAPPNHTRSHVRTVSGTTFATGTEAASDAGITGYSGVSVASAGSGGVGSLGAVALPAPSSSSDLYRDGSGAGGSDTPAVHSTASPPIPLSDVGDAGSTPIPTPATTAAATPAPLQHLVVAASTRQISSPTPLGPPATQASSGTNGGCASGGPGAPHRSLSIQALQAAVADAARLRLMQLPSELSARQQQMQQMQQQNASDTAAAAAGSATHPFPARGLHLALPYRSDSATASRSAGGAGAGAGACAASDDSGVMCRVAGQLRLLHATNRQLGAGEISMEATAAACCMIVKRIASASATLRGRTRVASSGSGGTGSTTGSSIDITAWSYVSRLRAAEALAGIRATGPADFAPWVGGVSVVQSLQRSVYVLHLSAGGATAVVCYAPFANALHVQSLADARGQVISAQAATATAATATAASPPPDASDAVDWLARAMLGPRADASLGHHIHTQQAATSAQQHGRTGSGGSAAQTGNIAAGTATAGSGALLPKVLPPDPHLLQLSAGVGAGAVTVTAALLRHLAQYGLPAVAYLQPEHALRAVDAATQAAARSAAGRWLAGTLIPSAWRTPPPAYPQPLATPPVNMIISPRLDILPWEGMLTAAGVAAASLPRAVMHSYGRALFTRLRQGQTGAVGGGGAGGGGHAVSHVRLPALPLPIPVDAPHIAIPTSVSTGGVLRGLFHTRHVSSTSLALPAPQVLAAAAVPWLRPRVRFTRCPAASALVLLANPPPGTLAAVPTVSLPVSRPGQVRHARELGWSETVRSAAAVMAALRALDASLPRAPLPTAPALTSPLLATVAGTASLRLQQQLPSTGAAAATAATATAGGRSSGAGAAEMGMAAAADADGGRPAHVGSGSGSGSSSSGSHLLIVQLPQAIAISQAAARGLVEQLRITASVQPIEDSGPDAAAFLLALTQPCTTAPVEPAAAEPAAATALLPGAPLGPSPTPAAPAVAVSGHRRSSSASIPLPLPPQLPVLPPRGVHPYLFALYATYYRAAAASQGAASSTGDPRQRAATLAPDDWPLRHLLHGYQPPLRSPAVSAGTAPNRSLQQLQRKYPRLRLLEVGAVAGAPPAAVLPWVQGRLSLVEGGAVVTQTRGSGGWLAQAAPGLTAASASSTWHVLLATVTDAACAPQWLLHLTTLYPSITVLLLPAERAACKMALRVISAALQSAESSVRSWQRQVGRLRAAALVCSGSGASGGGGVGASVMQHDTVPGGVGAAAAMAFGDQFPPTATASSGAGAGAAAGGGAGGIDLADTRHQAALAAAVQRAFTRYGGPPFPAAHVRQSQAAVQALASLGYSVTPSQLTAAAVAADACGWTAEALAGAAYTPVHGITGAYALDTPSTTHSTTTTSTTATTVSASTHSGGVGAGADPLEVVCQELCPPLCWPSTTAAVTMVPTQPPRSQQDSTAAAAPVAAPAVAAAPVAEVLVGPFNFATGTAHASTPYSWLASVLATLEEEHGIHVVAINMPMP